MKREASDVREEPRRARRPYQTPQLTVYGGVAELTKQVRPSAGSDVTDTTILFNGDNA